MTTLQFQIDNKTKRNFIKNNFLTFLKGQYMVKYSRFKMRRLYLKFVYL